MIILHIQLAAESTQIITVDSTITAAYVCRYIMNVSVCEFDSLRGRYSFVALIVKLHLESRYKVTFFGTLFY